MYWSGEAPVPPFPTPEGFTYTVALPPGIVLPEPTFADDPSDNDTDNSDMDVEPGENIDY